MNNCLAQFSLIDGSVFEQYTDLESVARFLLGEDPYWAFEFDADESGKSQRVFVPFHAIAYITWNETELDRKRAKKDS